MTRVVVRIEALLLPDADVSAVARQVEERACDGVRYLHGIERISSSSVVEGVDWANQPDVRAEFTWPPEKPPEEGK